MKDYIGKSIIVAVLLLFATAAMAMDTSTMLRILWGNSNAIPSGITYVTDSDGAYLTDEDGAYITL